MKNEIEKNENEMSFNGFDFDLKTVKPNAKWDSVDEKCNVLSIGKWNRSNEKLFESGPYTYTVKLANNVVPPSHWELQKNTNSWYGFNNIDDLNDVVDYKLSYDNYPPSIHGERKWTEKMLSNDSKLYRSLLRCVGSTPKYVEPPSAEHATPEGNRIDSVFINTEDYDENDERINPEFWSVEAMDATGKCDDLHFDKGTESYPMAIREMYGHCTGAIVIAAEFTESQIMRANEINNIGWMIALVTAEEIDGKTIFTLVN